MGVEWGQKGGNHDEVGPPPRTGGGRGAGRVDISGRAGPGGIPRPCHPVRRRLLAGRAGMLLIVERRSLAPRFALRSRRRELPYAIALPYDGGDKEGAGPSFYEEKPMIKFYYNTAPNPTKVALCLEEIGLPYELVPIDTRKGEQHTASFLAINPNAKVPAIVDDGATVFDSNAILLYLAEKTGQFLPGKSLAQRGEMLSWLMFVASGIGPYSGQSVHFRNFAPEPKDYAVNLYTFEPQPHFRILEPPLAN